jgi:hypothetical protein
MLDGLALETLGLVAFENFYRPVILPSAFLYGFRDLLDADGAVYFPGNPQQRGHDREHYDTCRFLQTKLIAAAVQHGGADNAERAQTQALQQFFSLAVGLVVVVGRSGVGSDGADHGASLRVQALGRLARLICPPKIVLPKRPIKETLRVT